MAKNPSIPSIEHVVRPVSDVVAAVDNVTPPVRDFQRALIEPWERQRRLFAGFDRWLRPLAGFLDAIDQEKRIVATSWISHPLLPLDPVTIEMAAHVTLKEAELPSRITAQLRPVGELVNELPIS